MKRFLSVLMVMMILCSLFTISTFAADNNHCPNCGGQLHFLDIDIGIAGVTTYTCESCGRNYATGSVFGHRWYQVGRTGQPVSGGASVETPKQYYTAPSSGSGGSDTTYNGGTTSYYSVMNTQNNTLNFTTYNKTTNNYTQNNYTYNNYTYNNEYNYYTYNIENHNYYVTNNYTYVTVVYPDGTKDENGNDNYESVDIYYKLPDGRNSYDLKADEIYGTYLTYNVTGAEKVLEDDGVTLGLWHLDGTLQDSSANVGTYIFYAGATTFVDVELDDWGKAISASTPYDFGVSGFTGGSPHSVEFRCYVASSSEKAKVYLPYTFTRNYTVLNDNAYFDAACTQKTVALTDRYYIEVPTNQWNSIYLYSSGTGLSVYVNGSSTTHYYYTRSGGPSALYYKSGYVENDPYPYSNTAWYSISGIVERNYSTFGDFTFSGGTKYTLDEFRLSNSQLYDGIYLPSSQPFDTNSVLIRPENPAENDIVVMSNIPVADYRIGGVRPTYPVIGSTFIYLENDVVQSIQQYQGDGWVSVDAFIWQDGEWKNLLKYNFADLKFEEPDEPAPSPSPSPDPGGCTHEYVVDSEKAPTCTVKGSTTYKCKLCGDSYTEDIPALGHDWQIVGTGGGTIVSPSPSPDSSSSVASSGSESTSEPTSSEPPAPTQPPATEPEYTLYRCSRCGMEYKDYEGSGPPSGGDEDEEEGGILGMLKKLLGSIVDGIASILETVLGGVIDLLVSLINQLVEGVNTVITGLINSMGQIASFGGPFKDFLGQVFPFIPSEIIILLGFSLSLSIILMIIKFFRG